MLWRLFFVFFLTAISFQATADVIVKIPLDKSGPICQGITSWEDEGEYHIELLKLALAESGTKARIQPVCMLYPSEERRIPMLQDGSEINVVFFGTTPQREKLLKAVYVPIFLGTTGLRMFIIRNDMLDIFSSARKLDDFRPFSFGQGLGWPDGDILQSSGFNVVKGPYESLHKMLSLGRFDAYPRSYWQVASELEWMSKDAENIAIVPNLAFYYPQPIYFFVSPKHPELHAALTRGLQKAYDNGKMLKLLQTNPQTAPSFSKIDVHALCLHYLPTKELTVRSLNAMRNFQLPEEYRPHRC